MKLHKHKKSSLSLSINAIVVLILAITMLGLGLGFMRTMFGKVSQSVEEQIGTEPEPPTPNVATPVTLSKSKVILGVGKTGALKVSGYNGGTSAQTQTPDVTCNPTAPLSSDKSFSTVFPANGGIRTVGVLITASTTTGTSLCQVGITNIGTAEFVLQVQ